MVENGCNSIGYQLNGCNPGDNKRSLPAFGSIGKPTDVEFNCPRSIDNMWSPFMVFQHLRLCLSD